MYILALRTLNFFQRTFASIRYRLQELWYGKREAFIRCCVRNGMTRTDAEMFVDELTAFRETRDNP